MLSVSWAKVAAVDMSQDWSEEQRGWLSANMGKVVRGRVIDDMFFPSGAPLLLEEGEFMILRGRDLAGHNISEASPEAPEGSGD